MSDTTTTLNAGAGGDVMDETLAIQGDGSTTAKRPRVEIALADDGLTPRIVGKNNPLPVSSESLEELLTEIRDELRMLRKAITRC